MLVTTILFQGEKEGKREIETKREDVDKENESGRKDDR